MHRPFAGISPKKIPTINEAFNKSCQCGALFSQAPHFDP
jgi:hypothetical protein